MNQKIRDLTLRVSVTDQCQMHCMYCKNASPLRQCTGAVSTDDIIGFIASVHCLFNLTKVRITGGEPLLAKGLGDLVTELSRMEIEDIGLTTNGQLLASHAAELRASGLQRINVSCDSLKPAVFRSITHGELERTLTGLQAAKEAGMAPIKLNMVVLRGINDAELCDMLEYSLSQHFELRFLELMPAGLGHNEFERLFVSSDEVLRRLRGRFKLEACAPVAGSTARRYRVYGDRGVAGHCGFISPYSHPFCTSCKRLRITSDGHLIGCLASPVPISIRDACRTGDQDEVAELVLRAFGAKRSHSKYKTMESMVLVGG